MSLWSWVKQILLLLCKQAGGLQHNLNTLQHTEVHLNGWTTEEFWVLTPYSPERARRKVFHVRKTIKSIQCKCLAQRGMGEATLQGHGRDCRAAERASGLRSRFRSQRAGGLSLPEQTLASPSANARRKLLSSFRSPSWELSWVQ